MPQHSSTLTSTSASKIQKKIRDTKRSLSKPSLPANVKLDLERRIKALELELKSAKENSKNLKLQQKYKYVKHVEKQKICRKLNQLQKNAQENQEQILVLLSQLDYIKYYPMDLKYISILSDPKDEASLIKKNQILDFIKNKKPQHQTNIYSRDVFHHDLDDLEDDAMDLVNSTRQEKKEQEKDEFFL